MTVQELIDELQRQPNKRAQVLVAVAREDDTLSRRQEVADVRFTGAEVLIEGGL